MFSAAALCLLLPFWSSAQQAPESVTIHVRADQSAGPIVPIWNYFGYDEPNYTYAPNGKKLLGELSALSSVPVYVRVHNLFTTGDGSASLKWGSTNVYTEDKDGKPVYSWTILDQIFDTFHAAGIRPIVEIGFMPEALSTRPEPYRHNFPKGSIGSIYTGWAYPPRDYAKWSELVFQFTRHLRERFGDAEVKTWLWEVWNEPDIDYWKGTQEEYFKLYDFTADAVLRAFPEARIGGPDSTGPGNPHAAEFLRQFLEHCAHQTNYATGKIGSPLLFISFHPKGSPKWLGDHVQMGVARQLTSIKNGFQIVASFPEWRETAHCIGRIGPRRLRGLFGARKSAKCVPQRRAFRVLHRRGHAQHLRVGGQRAHKFPRRRHLVVRIRGPAIFRRLPRTRFERIRQASVKRVPNVRNARRRARANHQLRRDFNR